MRQLKRWWFSVAFILSALFLFSFSHPATFIQAQDGTSVEVEGPVEAINQNIVTVAGRQIDIANVPDNTDSFSSVNLKVGVRVKIKGILRGNIIIAQTIIIIIIVGPTATLPPPTATPPPPTVTPGGPITPTATPLPGGVLINGFLVVFVSRVYDAVTNTTTFTYTVTGTGVPPDLSHFNIEVPICPDRLKVINFVPRESVKLGTDPTTGIHGVKWDQPLGVNASRTYSITFLGNIPGGSVAAAVKGGNGFQIGMVTGGTCVTSGLDVEKHLSTNGGQTWHDADSSPGLVVKIGSPVWFRFTVTNRGAATLNNISLSDNKVNLGSCPIPASLAPGASFECVVGPVNAVEGQHTNVATASGNANGAIVTDTDAANYYGSPETTIIIIEGPVTAIEGNIIIVNGYRIIIDPSHPLFARIKIGAIIRIEGGAIQQGGVVVIVVVNVIIVNIVVINVPPTNPTLEPGCKISKNGKIKCSKKDKQSKKSKKSK